MALLHRCAQLQPWILQQGIPHDITLICIHIITCVHAATAAAMVILNKNYLIERLVHDFILLDLDYSCVTLTIIAWLMFDTNVELFNMLILDFLILIIYYYSNVSNNNTQFNFRNENTLSD